MKQHGELRNQGMIIVAGIGNKGLREQTVPELSTGRNAVIVYPNGCAAADVFERLAGWRVVGTHMAQPQTRARHLTAVLNAPLAELVGTWAYVWAAAVDCVESQRLRARILEPEKVAIGSSERNRSIDDVVGDKLQQVSIA